VTHALPDLLHVLPLAQAPHAMPPVPHCVSLWVAYGTQVFPLQQPVGHDAGLQMHCPALQARPASHL